MSALARGLRIAFFGSASRTSLLALRALTADQHVVAAVLAQPKARGLRHSLLRLAGLRPRPAVEVTARRRGIPVISVSDGREPMLAERLHALRPDLICIVIFPRLIAPELIALAPLGAINMHPSLLPRHRGPLPILWTYQADDRQSGVTIHHASEQYDAGDMILQEAMPLPRGYPAAKLDLDGMALGATLLHSAVELLASGRAPRIAQDEAAATYAPQVRPGTPMVQFDTWDVERVWHFLAGLCPRFREPLDDGRGGSAVYQSVVGFEPGPAGPPGTVESVRGGWKLHCRGGVVLLGESA